MKSFLATLLVLVLLCSLASAQFWPTVTTKTNMGTFQTYNIQNLTNGKGLSSMTLSATHSTTWQDMWISNQIKTGWVEFDLGSIQLLRTIAMWNYNSSISTGRGVASMDVYLSLDGSKYQLLRRETPPQANAQPLPAHLIQVVRPARYIKFDILANYGNSYTGMSEVQFVVGACAGSISSKGTGCKDAGGTPNNLAFSGCPDRGTTLTLQMNASKTATHPLHLVAGRSDKNWSGVPLPFDMGILGVPGCYNYISHTLMFGSFVPKNGQATFPLAIPQATYLIGSTIHFQFFNFEVGLNPPHFSTSNYLTIVIG